MQKFNAIRLN